MPYGLKDIELAKLNEVFAANKRIERVVLYGSRAKGNYKPFSDVDITLEGDELTHTDLSRLSLAIDDLLLPYQFDISIFHTLKNEALIDHIRRMGITIYERETVPSTSSGTENTVVEPVETTVYHDIAGFCASVPVSRVAELDYVLTPGRYVGLPEEEDDFNFAERFTALKVEFEEQLKEEERLNKVILENLGKIKLD